MDRARVRRVLTLSGAVLLTAALRDDFSIRAARWTVPTERLALLTREPAECVGGTQDAAGAARIAIGRAAFRAPLLLGGQAARAGLSCNSCHRGGRSNPAFAFPGLSGAPGTADVTSSIFSSHRGDGRFNPKAIPDLGGAKSLLKVAQQPEGRQLETFIRGLIVEEFDGPGPSPATIDGLASYVRSMAPAYCPAAAERPITLAAEMADARGAIAAAIHSYQARDVATARLMVGGARSTLGLIDERYRGSGLGGESRRLHQADEDLRRIQEISPKQAEAARAGLNAWLNQSFDLEKHLARSETRSLFNPKRLSAVLGEIAAREKRAE